VFNELINKLTENHIEDVVLEPNPAEKKAVINDKKIMSMELKISLGV